MYRTTKERTKGVKEEAARRNIIDTQTADNEQTEHCNNENDSLLLSLLIVSRI